MAKLNLGRVKGDKGDTGAQGAKGDTGAVGEYGMWDMVNNCFFGNQGTGSFTGGDEV